MLTAEYDREMDIAVNRREAREEGREEGRQEGHENGLKEGIEKEKLIIAKNLRTHNIFCVKRKIS